MKKHLKKFFDSINLDVTDDLERQNIWLGWYQGKDAWYDYKVTGPTHETIERKRLSMNILSRVCTDWASLLLNENTLISLGSEEKDLTAENEHLQNIFDETGFLSNMQQFVERYFAIGTGALVFGRDGVNGKANGKVRVSYVDGTRCFVAGQRYGEPEKVAFVTDLTDKLTLISVHSPGLVENYVIDDKENSLDVAAYGLDAQEKHTYPTFVWLKPAVARRSEWTSPYGQSIFGAAIDANKLLDRAFDGYANELDMGRKRIFVSTDILTFKKTKDSKVPQPTFDPNDVVFQMLPEIANNSEGVNDKIKEVDMNLRQTEYSNAVQDGLNYVSANSYLGSHYYEFTHETGQVTATQVVSANSVLYRNLRKQENALERSLRKAVYIMLAVEGVEISLSDVRVKWDDSIIVDEETERQTDLQDVREGIMSKVEFRVKWYGETEEQAREKLAGVEAVDLAPEF